MKYENKGLKPFYPERQMDHNYNIICSPFLGRKVEVKANIMTSPGTHNPKTETKSVSSPDPHAS